jgi:hypothetical protein
MSSLPRTAGDQHRRARDPAAVGPCQARVDRTNTRMSQPTCCVPSPARSIGQSRRAQHGRNHRHSRPAFVGRPALGGGFSAQGAAWREANRGPGSLAHLKVMSAVNSLPHGWPRRACRALRGFVGHRHRYCYGLAGVVFEILRGRRGNAGLLPGASAARLGVPPYADKGAVIPDWGFLF